MYPPATISFEVAGKIKVAGFHFDHVYTSPLKRAHRTAQIITDMLSISKPVILPDLVERDFGVMTGRPVSSIQDFCSPDIIQAEVICYFLNPEGAETFPDLVKRGQHVLSTLMANHKRGSILLVTHGDIGKMLYAAYYGLDWKEVLTMFHFGNSELLELSESSSKENAHVFRIDQYNG